MLNNLWEYAFQKNWDRKLTEAMVKSNVFCYGKTASGKTTCVAKPMLWNALNKGRSCIVFSDKHPNMTKKLKQLFPKWDFLTDDYIRRWNRFNHPVIFYWTGHSSHLMMQYVNARLTKNAAFLYVTATNIDRLVAEMQERYYEYTQSQKENGGE